MGKSGAAADFRCTSIDLQKPSILVKNFAYQMLCLAMASFPTRRNRPIIARSSHHLRRLTQLKQPRSRLELFTSIQLFFAELLRHRPGLRLYDFLVPLRGCVRRHPCAIRRTIWAHSAIVNAFPLRLTINSSSRFDPSGPGTVLCSSSQRLRSQYELWATAGTDRQSGNGLPGDPTCLQTRHGRR